MSAEDFYFDANFRLQPKHLKGMETDNSIMECFRDSSKLDNVIGDDSFVLSALKNDVKERCIETARSWKSIVTYIFGTGDELSQIENTPFQEQDFIQNALLCFSNRNLIQQRRIGHYNRTMQYSKRNSKK